MHTRTERGQRRALTLVLCTLLCSSLAVSVSAASGSSAGDSWNIQADSKEQAMLQSVVLQDTIDGTQSGSAAVAARSNQLLGSWFASYKNAFNKQYSNKTAEINAYRNFVGHIKSVAKTNLDSSIPFWQSPNQYSDLSPQEFKSTVLMQINPLAGNGSRRLVEDAGELDFTGLSLDPEPHARKLLGVRSKDWRALNKLTSVKDQGMCGSCWAFSATAVIESAYLIANKQNGIVKGTDTINLSEQQLVACANGVYWSDGCNGGYSDMAIKYVQDKDQTTESKYGYLEYNNDGTYGTTACNNGLVSKLTTGQYVKLNPALSYVKPANNELALMNAVDKGPVVIYFDVENSFQNYQGGWYNGGDCGSSTNHAMVLVGYVWTGKYDKTSYWIIRNSWSSDWGEKGYIRVSFGHNGIGTCGMYQFGVQPAQSFKAKCTKCT